MKTDTTGKTQRERAVVCLSGGMDSCVTAAMAAKEYDTYGIHFSYGQRTETKEFESARAVAQELGMREMMNLRIDIFRRIGGSALTDTAIDVPRSAVDAPLDGSPEHAIPVTYVPFRNAHFLSAAVSWAEVIGAKKVFIGAVEQDSSGYPDCRPAYYEAFNKLIQTGTKDGDIRIVTPLIAMKKAEIIRAGLELKAPFHVTWSCYSSDTAACGVCDSCTLRLRAFSQAGFTDPIPYKVAR
ncbi:MAG: 7-cyano-7-deazaguanine synthase QueC [Acidobacteriaceae bacterium]|jgi:7-cyano-7-deazaguanine synthase|nr:7-cyano-7-deazaguanine synthase QueC [Acidobacteriaceae bacterium]